MTRTAGARSELVIGSVVAAAGLGSAPVAPFKFAPMKSASTTGGPATSAAVDAAADLDNPT